MKFHPNIEESIDTQRYKGNIESLIFELSSMATTTKERTSQAYFKYPVNLKAVFKLLYNVICSILLLFSFFVCPC